MRIYIQMPAKWTILKSKKEIKPEEIISKVCKYYGVDEIGLKKKDRHSIVLTPRQVSMYLIRKHTNLYLKEIGNLFGGRDHATVIHAIRTVKDLSDTEEDYRDDVYRIEQKIIC